MPAARYWKIASPVPYGGGDLSLSEVEWYEGASRVDSGATITSASSPSSGSTSLLSDSSTAAAVTWAAAGLLLPSFFISWDFGTARDIDKVRLAGPAQATFPNTLVLQYSTDGINWSNVVGRFPQTKWMGASSFFEASKAAGDANFSSVVMLLRGFGTPGSTLFLDESPVGRAQTQSAIAQVSTVQTKYGGTAVMFNDATRADFQSVYIDYPGSTDFEFPGDFTIEFWTYPYTYSGLYGNFICTVRTPSSGTVGWEVTHGLPGVNKLSFVYISGGSLVFQILSNNTLPLNTWTHVAICRSGSTITMYINGVAQTQTATNSSTLSQGNMCRFGVAYNNATTTGYSGFLDDFRITKGLARYTANFTPPTLELPAGEFGSANGNDVLLLAQSRYALQGVSFLGSQDLGAVSYKPSLDSYANDREDGGLYRVAGTVKEKSLPANVPLRRKVRLHREIDGRLIREMWSDATTGAYSFDYIRGDAKYFVVSFDYSQTYRAVIADNVTPELMT